MRIYFYGRLRDLAPAGPVPPDLRDTRAVTAWLARERPELLHASVRIAVNDELIVGDKPLGDDDEIAFLPPMSGG